MAGEQQAPVECRIYIDNKSIDDRAQSSKTPLLHNLIREVRVTMSRTAADVGSIVFDTFRLENGDFVVQDSGLFQPWRHIRIDAYFGKYHEEVLRGYIREVKCEYPQEIQSAQTIVEIQDESLLLDREHLKSVWGGDSIEISDGNIAEQIAQRYDLGCETHPGIKHTRRLHQDSTPIIFLKARAEANGFECYVRDKILHFHKPSWDSEAQPTIMVYAGSSTNCVSLNINHDGHKPDSIGAIRSVMKRSGPDRITIIRKPSDDRSEEDSSNDTGNELSSPFLWYIPRPFGANDVEVEARAQALADQNAFKVVAEGELDGAAYGHVLKTYKPVKIDGAGKMYDGLYYVDEVTHLFSLQGYRQQFKIIGRASGQTKTTWP